MLGSPLARVLLVVALTLGVAAVAVAYEKPPGGKWKIQDSFEATKGGALTLSKKGTKITKLVLNVGDDNLEACGGKKVVLVGQPKIKSYKSVNGRFAVGQLKKGLFEPIAAKYKVGGKTVPGTVLFLWDESGRFADSAEVALGEACNLSFHARKK